MEFEETEYKTYLIKQITNQKNTTSFQLHSTNEKAEKFYYLMKAEIVEEKI